MRKANEMRGEKTPEFNLGFSRKLAETSRLVADDDVDSFYAVQTIVYLNLLACEIALKALLEKSGMEEPQIKTFKHNLKALLGQVCRCEVVEKVGGHPKWVPAARIRGVPIKSEDAASTVGDILESKQKRASRYPNEIR